MARTDAETALRNSKDFGLVCVGALAGWFWSVLFGPWWALIPATQFAIGCVLWFIYHQGRKDGGE